MRMTRMLQQIHHQIIKLLSHSLIHVYKDISLSMLCMTLTAHRYIRASTIYLNISKPDLNQMRFCDNVLY